MLSCNWQWVIETLRIRGLRITGLDNENNCIYKFLKLSNGRKGYTCNKQEVATSVAFRVSNPSWIDDTVGGVLGKDLDCCSVPWSPGQVQRHWGQVSPCFDLGFHAICWWVSLSFSTNICLFDLIKRQSCWTNCCQLCGICLVPIGLYWSQFGQSNGVLSKRTTLGFVVFCSSIMSHITVIINTCYCKYLNYCKAFVITVCLIFIWNNTKQCSVHSCQPYPAKCFSDTRKRLVAVNPGPNIKLQQLPVIWHCMCNLTNR